jgi:hypothetical protein
MAGKVLRARTPYAKPVLYNLILKKSHTNGIFKLDIDGQIAILKLNHPEVMCASARPTPQPAKGSASKAVYASRENFHSPRAAGTHPGGGLSAQIEDDTHNITDSVTRLHRNRTFRSEIPGLSPGYAGTGSNTLTLMTPRG